MSKKFLGVVILVVAIVAVLMVLLCFNKGDEEVSGTLEDLMGKLYEGIAEEELPMALGNIELTSENIESYIGTADIEYAEAIANESMVGSIAHSVVLMRLENANDADGVVQKIKANVNPRKWICVEASNVVVKSKGNLVVLIMSSEELAPKLETNFDNL